ncbi:MAG: 2-hydroxyacyl-CoA dehydratase family protein [Thermodesulfobacteriota bacterium]|nr:2-hydroxyacyl-CoA dehydratase family protein [Thermodesulfobacteriota bacterium]
MTIEIPKKKELQVPSQMFDILMAYAANVKIAKEEGKPVVWSSVLIPKEIFQAMDVSVIYLELLSAVVSLMQSSGHYCEIAEEKGFSRDVCAFHRCFIGCAAAEERDPLLDAVFSTPDLIIATNLPCISESKSLLFSAKHFNCPYILIDTPLNTWENFDVPDFTVEYYVSQLREAISLMQEQGYIFDLDRLKETVDLSRRLMLILKEVESYRKAVPTPIGPVDALWCAAGTRLAEPKIALDMFAQLRDELKERVENKIGVLDNEKLRLYFFGVPSVYNLELLNYPEKYGAIMIKSWLEYLFGGSFDPSILNSEKPLESLAVLAITNILNPPFGRMLDFTVEEAKEFHADGILSVVKRSCGLLPGMTRPIKDAVFDQVGIPTTIFDLDGLDTRERDDITAMTNIDSFIETLLASKRRS